MESQQREDSWRLAQRDRTDALLISRGGRMWVEKMKPPITLLPFLLILLSVPWVGQKNFSSAWPFVSILESRCMAVGYVWLWITVTSQEYLIPILLQALDFLNKKTTSMVVVNPLAQTASEEHHLQHSFSLDHCYCSRTLNVRCRQPLKCFALMSLFLKVWFCSTTSELYHLLSGCLEPGKSPKGSRNIASTVYLFLS